MNILRFAVFLVVVACVGCQGEGACVVPSGTDVICTQQKKGVCEQGKGHKFIGGECATAGYAKKVSDGVWEKK